MSTTASTPAELAGRTLRMMRNAHGATVGELAGLAGCSPQHLSQVELGRRNASPALTQRLADALARLAARA